MSLESAELWKNAFEIAGVFLLLLTFVAGAGVLWFSRRVNVIQTAELRGFQLRIESEQQKTAEAQKEAADAQRQVNEAIVGRLLARQISPQFTESLKALPPGKAEIWHRDSDPESWIYAISIRDGLKAAAWSVPEDMKSIPANRFNGKDLPLFGVTVFDRYHEGFFPFPPNNPTVIAAFLGASGKPADMRLATLLAGVGSGIVRRDASLKDGTFRILVGPRDPTR